MKRKKNVVYRKSISLLAAAAMTAVLMSGQIYPVTAADQNIESSIKTSSIIPDNVTIDEPVALSEIELPKSDYGTLSWVDDTYVPTKRVQSCKVVFKPAKDVDLSYLPGWDSEDKVVTGKITVVVTSLEDEETDENAGDSTTDGSLSEEPAQDSERDTESDSQEDGAENTDTSADGTGDAAAEDPADSGKVEEDSGAGSKDANSVSGNTETDESTGADSATAGENTDGSAQDDILASAGEKNTDSGNNSAPEENLTKEGEENTEGGDSDTTNQAAPSESAESVTNEAAVNESDNTEQTDKINEPLTDIMPGATVFDEKEEDSDKNQEKNIFDNPLDFTVAGTRPSVVTENLTEEEQAAIAVENHSCEGISVSGIELPWYVQFQVSSGENYEFKNEDKAAIFQSYEFKLWDLKNDTEYEIPDGQYISVTIPVKEGYDYSIEHLLDNGATETIVPSVNGSTMIFSTHSFSPFGIAGFRPIIGEEIADNAYGATATPTPTPTVTVSGTPTPSPAVTGAGSSGSSTAGNTSSSGNSGNKGAGSTTGGNDTGNVGSSGTGSAAAGTGISGNGSGTSGDSNVSTGSGAAGTGSSTAVGGNQSGTAVSGNGGQNQTSNAVKTGDNTVILPFVILVFAAVVVIIVVLLVRKKKNK